MKKIVFQTALVLGLLLTCHNAFSQSLIVGIPSPETVPEGELIFTHESQFAFSPKKYNSFNFLLYGLNETTELSAALVGVADPPVDVLSGGLGIKKSYFLIGSHESDFALKGTFGSTLVQSLRGQGLGNWSYGSVAVTIPKLKTRITQGVTYGTREFFGREIISYMVGVEQPINKRFSFVADWYSGTHDLAAFIPALQINLTKLDNLIIGLKIPNNQESGNLAIIFEINKRLWSFGKNKKAKIK